MANGVNHVQGVQINNNKHRAERSPSGKTVRNYFILHSKSVYFTSKVDCTHGTEMSGTLVEELTGGK